MKLIIDDANIEKVREIWDLYPCDGVTTNPSILAKSKRPPYEVLSELREIVGKDGELHVQVVSKDAEGMVKEANVIRERLGANTFVKIPTTPQGLKAMRELAPQGVNITATAIYTLMQAFLAAKAGAKYTAPYVNRIDNFDTTVFRLQWIFRIYLKTTIYSVMFLQQVSRIHSRYLNLQSTALEHLQ